MTTTLIDSRNEMATANDMQVPDGFTDKLQAAAVIAKLQLANKQATKMKRARKNSTTKILASQVTKTAGPRGFKFGPVWTEAVRKVEGIALFQGNFAKLLAHAQMLGVYVPDDASQEEVAKAVSAAMTM